MAVMEAAIKLRDQGIDVVDFGPGEPDFPTPENVKRAAVRAIEANFTKYTAIGGIKELKKAIVEKHKHRWMEPVYVAAEADYSRIMKSEPKKKKKKTGKSP